jgi:aconitate hydratase 2/2-methylisocitrate dehydratase
VLSTSTRNFPNRLGDGANVYLASAELAAVAAVEGRLPSVDEYRRYMGEFDAMAGEIYRYMNFHEIEEYQNAASNVIPVAQEA